MYWPITMLANWESSRYTQVVNSCRRKFDRFWISSLNASATTLTGMSGHCGWRLPVNHPPRANQESVPFIVYARVRTIGVATIEGSCDGSWRSLDFLNSHGRFGGAKRTPVLRRLC